MDIKIGLSNHDYGVIEKISILRNENITQTAQFIMRGFISAQQSVQLTAYGEGWRGELSMFLIRLGWCIAKFGGN